MNNFKLKENEYLAWLKDQKTLLERQKDEKDLLRAAKKRLKDIDRDINKNNDWLRKQK